MKIFRYWKFAEDMQNSSGFEDASRLWAKNLDGEIVYEITDHSGICNGLVIHFDWCEEVQSYGK